MYKYKAEILNKSNYTMTTDESNNMSKLVSLMSKYRNVIISIRRIHDNKLMMRVSK